LDIASLKALIAGGETPSVEFKIAPPRPAELAERLCGFANTLGGFVILGVVDKTWEVAGVKSPSAALDILLQAARLCKPSIKFDPSHPQIVELDGKSLVIAHIPPNNGTLYQASGVCWIRRGTYTVPLTVPEIEEFLYAQGVLPWETQPVARATLADLDMEFVDAYLEQRSARSKQNGRLISREDLLLNSGCLTVTRDETQQDVLRPTNAGLLLFGRDPQQFLLQAEVVCVLYKPTTGKQQRYADRRILHGTITQQVDQAEAFFNQYIPIAAHIEGFHRIDEPDYPIEALREAVVNAVVHRDYSLKGEAVRIFFYPDHIEIHNPGILMPGLTLEDLQQGVARSRPRNPVVTTVLRDFPGGYMEKVGSGIRFMIEQMRELGRPDPIFREQGEFLVNFFRDTSQQADSPTRARTARSSKSTAQEQSVTNPDTASKRRQQALQYVQKHGYLSERRYRAITGLSADLALQDLEHWRSQGVLRRVSRAQNIYYTR
jgi:ATP-dependent DNA helicase RecG